MAKTITIGGKTYVLDRGRYKDNKNVGSVSSSKSPQELYRQRVLREQSAPPIKKVAKAVGKANKILTKTAEANREKVKQYGRLGAEKVKRGVQSAGWAEVVRAADMPRRMAADNKTRNAQAIKIAKRLSGEGMLTEKDIERVKGMLPKATDSKAMRDKKFAALKGVMAGAAAGAAVGKAKAIPKVKRGAITGAAMGTSIRRSK
jgi:hypothetical protein